MGTRGVEEYVVEVLHIQWMLFVVAEKAGTAGNSDIHTVPPFSGMMWLYFFSCYLLCCLSVCLSLRIQSDIIVTSLVPNSPTEPGRKTPSNAAPCVYTRCPFLIMKSTLTPYSSRPSPTPRPTPAVSKA